MLRPDAETPPLPPWVSHQARVGHNLITTIGEADATDGIRWAAELIDRGTAEEYALGATTLEDVYVRLTGHTSADGAGRPEMAAVTWPQPAVTLRRGLPYWLESYRALIRWHLAGLRMWVMLLVVIQVMAGAGFVLGIGLFFAHIPATVALYVCTGVPVINLIMIGLILGPQLVAAQKLQQSYDFVRSMPAPQTAAAMAWYTVCLLAGLPAVVVSLLIAEARYGITFTISPAIVPAVLLTAFTGTMIGYGLGHAVPNPMVTQLVTQLLVFAIFGFTPILFPPWQLPHWLATLNWWFPFEHMAVIVRAGLTAHMVTGVASSYLIVAAWAGIGAAAAAWALGRRG